MRCILCNLRNLSISLWTLIINKGCEKNKPHETETHMGGERPLYLCNYIHSPLDTQAESFAVAHRDTKHN